MTQLEIRRLRRDEIPALEAFVDGTYGAGAAFKHLPRLQWQFVDDPFRPDGDSDPTVFVAVDEERVVGTIGVQDGVARVDREEIPMGWIVDVMVAPAFRRKGLGHRIHAAAMDDRAALITLTMAEGTRRIAERAGCMTLGPTKEYVRPISISPGTIRRFLADKAHNGGPRRRQAIRLFNASRVGPLLAAAVIHLVSLFRRPVTRRGSFRVEEVDRFPGSVDELWIRVRDRYPAVFERSTTFLNWRFCDVPDLRYRRFLLHRGGELCGYVVTRVGTDSELPVGVVVDVFADPDDRSALDALLAVAADELAPHCEFLEGAASTASYQAAFERNGYLATRTMRPTIVCSDRDLDRRLRRFRDDWHFTKADHDWDQVHPVP